ncbi:MAG: carbonic anhydrase [Kastovskya adunca ATA6-11-RM4]|nr:carbonic anhydrase [Kastovskya adunca ATA6-11-RM4]
MQRRTMLKLLATSGAGTVLGLGATSLRSAIAQEGGIEWGYIGAEGPENWSSLSSTYSACRAGLQQSPINLQGAIEAELPDVEISYNSVPLKIINNGQTIQVNTVPGNRLIINGEEYELLQFHFHHPSEHTVEGEAYPMEAHFVHQNRKGELAVLGVLLKEGAENQALMPVWAAIPQQKSPEKSISGTQIDLAQMLPVERDSFRYFGSLTTPPCSEIVRWIVLEQPVEVSTAQIEKFSKLFPLNARPIQPLNRRYLLRSS